MACRILSVLGALAAVASGSQVQQAHLGGRGALASAHVGRRGGGFVRGMEFKHRLRICNAYPYSAAMDVYRGHGEKLTGDGPMAYKDCRDFAAPLKAGDRLEFRVGDAQAGTFSVSDLPNNDAVLLLVIHRHDVESTAVSFESHVFANLLNAQVAVIDTYRGKAKAHTRIVDVVKPKKDGEKEEPPKSEELRFDSVVAVNQGLYEVDLEAEDGEPKAKEQLVALSRQSYVVMRTGVEAEAGESFPEELVVYPRSPVAALNGAARSPFSLVVAAVVAAMACAASAQC